MGVYLLSKGPIGPAIYTFRTAPRTKAFNPFDYIYNRYITI